MAIWASQEGGLAIGRGASTARVGVQTRQDVSDADSISKR